MLYAVLGLTAVLGALPGCRGCRDRSDVLPTTDLLELAGCEETVVYLDQDADGYGDPAAAMRSCAAPASVVANALDCDDQDPTLSPAEEAVCADNLDNDCDGEPDCPSLERRTGLDEATAVLVDQYQSYAGWGMSIADLTGDGAVDLLLGSPSAEEGDYRGRVRLVAGPVMGQVDLTSDEVPDISSDEDNLEGEFVSTGDLDGDGYVDLLMGVSSSDREEDGLYIVSGPVSSEYSLDRDGPTYLDADYGAGDDGGGDYAKVQTADVYGGDGQDDLFLEVSRDNDGRGSAFFMPGPILEGGSVYDAAETAVYAVWEDEATYVSNVNLVGDINGDGIDDVAAWRGALYIIFDLPTGTYDVVDLGDVVLELGRRDLGKQFLSPGDVDGDGLDDLLTTPANPVDVYWGSSPYVYLFTSGTLNAATDGSALDVDDDNTAIFDGGSYSQIGMGMAAPGDLNADGYADVFIGDAQASGGDGDSYAGRAALWYSPVEGTVTPGQADILIQGDEIGSRTGWRVAASPRDEHNNAILLVGTWPFFGDSTLYQFTPDGY